jgi:hypothetical protein
MNLADIPRTASLTLAALLLGACYVSTTFPADDEGDAAADGAGESPGADGDAAAGDATPETPPCSGGLTLCGGECVDLAGDPDHCGACDAAYPWGASDPDENERGCLDPALGVFRFCCAGACTAPSDLACSACDAPCTDGRCSGLWDAAAGSCDFACLSLGGAVGEACAAPEDCAPFPALDATCLPPLGF